MQAITPCLWFASQAEEAMQFYLSVFPQAEMVNVMRHTASSPGTEGTLLAATFRLQGQEFMVLNGNPNVALGPTISFMVSCRDQAEVDAYWDQLLEGGKSMACGWLQDRFGVAWQITPARLPEMLRDGDRARADRVMKAMMGMVKLDIAGLEAAWRDEAA
jgi:predicted 3-demethylubiquinone-9 3-methyltransferase (glyoxalase superfamily)